MPSKYELVPQAKTDVAPLFQPCNRGILKLTNRMVYAPLTRMRCNLEGVPQPHMQEYYTQRATAGSLFISEGTYVSQLSIGYARAPGIYTQEQTEAWKPIVEAVKAKGATFFCQLFHCGRGAHADLTGGEQPVSASAIAISSKFKIYSPSFEALDYPVPRELAVPEIKEIVSQFAAAAKNALAAGFDGVELHGANGYLSEQFMKSSTNKRTDEYGGSIEKRCRFTLEVVDAMVEAVGAEKVGIRLSPFADFLDAVDDTPYATYVYLIEQLNKRKLAYVHMIEGRITAAAKQEDLVTDHEPHRQTLDPFRKVWDGLFLAAGGYTAKSGAEAIASGHADLIVYGRWWLANPDLPKRFKLGAPLNKYDRATFYSPGMEGYLDYPYLEAIEASA